MLWFTDMGWMMGPFLVLGALGLGAAAVLYDGTPDFPHAGRLWEVCARHNVTHLGIAPTAIRSLMVHGDELPRQHDLSALRILGSTGEAWNPEPYRWFSSQCRRRQAADHQLFRWNRNQRRHLGCFPIRAARCRVRFMAQCLAWTRTSLTRGQGNSVRGQVGELVVRQPWPGMTLGFWHDDERYLQTYWSKLRECLGAR